MSDYLCHTIFCSTHSLLLTVLYFTRRDSIQWQTSWHGFLQPLGRIWWFSLPLGYIYVLRGGIVVTQSTNLDSSPGFATNPCMSLRATASQSIKQHEIGQPQVLCVSLWNSISKYYYIRSMCSYATAWYLFSTLEAA